MRTRTACRMAAEAPSRSGNEAWRSVPVVLHHTEASKVVASKSDSAMGKVDTQGINTLIMIVQKSRMQAPRASSDAYSR